MNTDGNTDAINHHLAERDEYDEQREQEAELQDLRDEVDALTAKMADARFLLVDASVQLREGKIKTRRNRADLIDDFVSRIGGVL